MSFCFQKMCMFTVAPLFRVKALCISPPLQSIAGAGGGGYMVLITRSPGAKPEIEHCLKKEGFKDVNVHNVTIDRDGVLLSIGGKNVEIAQK